MTASVYQWLLNWAAIIDWFNRQQNSYTTAGSGHTPSPDYKGTL